MEIRKIGGARVGLFNVTWPFATLKVDLNTLELSTVFMGNYTFKSDDIISIKPYGVIPFMGRGIRINHQVKGYDPKIVFWTLGSPEKLIKKIHKTQFFH